MLSNGLDPLPTVHIGAPLSEFAKYFDKTDYVAIGGVAQLPDAQRINWIAEVFKAYPAGKFHGFGITSLPLLRKFAWTSVDSSAAKKRAIFGEILFEGNQWAPISNHSNPRIPHKRTPLRKQSILDYLVSAGIDFREDLLMAMDASGEYERTRVNIAIIEKVVATGLVDTTPEQGRLF
jgi:hypothetical protein